jgi:hypothetical protein
MNRKYMLDYLTERINPNGWRVISNPSRQIVPEVDELKMLIRSMRGRQHAGDERKTDETESPEAAKVRT